MPSGRARPAPRLRGVLTVRATIGEIPPDHKGGYDLATDEVSADGESYEAAMAAVRRLVPDGWRILHVTVVRPGS